jgi:uncharacterized membrane protein
MAEETEKSISQILHEKTENPILKKMHEQTEKPISQILREGIEHNPRHYIVLNIFNKEIRPCARCFGLWIGTFFGFIFSSPFWLGIIKTENFNLVFILAWLFAMPSIFDWSTVKLGLRKGKNSVRVFAGFFHGVGVIIYFLVLPAGIIFKILTYALYEGVFQIFRITFHLNHYKRYEKETLQDKSKE